MSRRGDSNSRPTVYKTPALPAELRRRAFRLYEGVTAPTLPPQGAGFLTTSSLREADGIVYEVATVVWAGSRGLTVTRFTGRLSLRNVVTKVRRVGSHQVIRYFGPGGIPPGIEKL